MELTRNHFTKEIYAMSSIPQNHFDENDLIDCVQRFFPNIMLAIFLPDVMGWKKKVFHLFLCFVTNSATFLSEGVCICSNGLALLRKIFQRTLFYRFLNSVKTNWLRFTSLLAADIVNNDLKDLTDDNRKNVSSLMTAFLIVPAARKQNWHQRFSTTPICISKKVFGCLP